MAEHTVVTAGDVRIAIVAYQETEQLAHVRGSHIAFKLPTEARHALPVRFGEWARGSICSRAPTRGRSAQRSRTRLAQMETQSHQKSPSFTWGWPQSVTCRMHRRCRRATEGHQVQGRGRSCCRI